ncbi:MAG TPA: hypothetical protein VMV05_02385 [bacterium]|nr:hypothetical protein [bacterium]
MIRPKGTLVPIILAFLTAILGGHARAWAGGANILVLDCTNSKVPGDLTEKSSAAYLPAGSFDDSVFEADGTIAKEDFDGLLKSKLKKPKGSIRFFSRKNDEIDVYIVTSIPMKASARLLDSGAPPPILMVGGPLTFSSPPGAGKGTGVSQPVTLSILQSARFLLEEQKRPTSLESGRSEVVSSFFGVSFKALPGPAPEGKNVYYYHLEKYKLKSDSGTLKLSFQNQNGNLQSIATVMTGPSENWFLMAGGPVFSYNLENQSTGNAPGGLYVSLNWSIHDIYDPRPRWLIVSLLGINTTNPASDVGLAGIGMGFPKMSDFIPLSTLAVTGSLFYNLKQSQFEFVAMVDYDIGDIFQLFH